MAQPAGAQDHKLKVVTTFLPVYCFTVNVAGDLAEVQNLLPPGADPHDFQFSPREMRILNGADLLVVNGLGVETWLDRILRSRESPKCVVQASAGLTSELIKSPPYLAVGEPNGLGPLVHGQPPVTGPNPHIWLDPSLAAHAVTNILTALQKADPANAAGYERNARQYLERLNKLDAELRGGLAPFKGDAIITVHDAFPYFARRYGLRIVGVIEKVPEVEPSLKYLGVLGGLAQREHVKAIFSERQSPPQLPEQLGRDYHVPVAQLDDLETGEIKPDAYERGMRKNLEILKRTLK